MLLLLLLPLLWGGSFQGQQPGHGIQMQESASVQVGGCINVPCSFPSAWTSVYPSGNIYIYWYYSGRRTQNLELVATYVPNKRVKRDTRGRFSLMDPRANCSLSIRDARKSDAGIYVLRVHGPYTHRNDYQEKKLTLQVTDAPQNLTIRASYRNVTVFKILQTTSLPILKGEALRLLCVADSNPPAQLSWFQGSSALSATPISRAAILELPRVGTGEEGQFTCQARHPLGSRSISFNLSVVYAPQLLGPSCSWKNQSLNCSCSSRAQPAPSLWWRLGEGLLEEISSNTSYKVISHSVGPWANSSLSLPAWLSTGRRLSCEAENVHGAQSGSVLLLLPGQAVPECTVVPAALAGAGAMVLLSLCLCLILFCIVKAHRKRKARRQKVTNDEDPVMGMITWNSQQNPQADRPPDQELPMGDASPSGEEQDTQYANLTFHGRKLCEAQDKEATSTCVYSEIKKTSQ
ncbi:sialic acid-binding Ig-like lectin 5 [Artibeus jamaicensis]|uniref:sialic acid-binding Ig-like lectin 5 n=1 Tax=Artibeus jamaicensis TaxID=9417 RepID=UPI00235A6D80|nr:sialic acid-binding Ig-like lectin 5 [Artibeus jamaicensis]